MADDLDAQIRRADPDRWLASRLIADEAARADVIALYAFNHELARAPEVASQPLVGEMRLAWWGEALEEIFEGRRVRTHPVAQALERAVKARALPRGPLDAMTEARLADLDGGVLEPEKVEPYIDATAVGLMGLAARVLARDSRPEQVVHAGRAWALAGLARAGRLPKAWTAEEVRRQVDVARALAAGEIEELPVDAFPAVAYATLAPAYARGRAQTELGRKARITWAAATGRI